MRIEKRKLYNVLLEDGRVIVVTGAAAHERYTRFDVIGEWIADGRWYRLADGHFPEFCPVVLADEVRTALQSYRAMYAEVVPAPGRTSKCHPIH